MLFFINIFSTFYNRLKGESASRAFTFSNSLHWLYGIIILLLFPALFINLGYMTMIDDEALRALVAMEMDIFGNYIVPTINGEYYYNKPPLYNWILLLFFKLTGTISEFTCRLPTVIFLLLYGATIFYFFKKHFSTKTAFINSLVLITCGRMLFWDSLLGLIDVCFSWLMFMLFMVIYHQGEKEKWQRLFVLSYLLTALGFMMKGLPAIVFQGITLLAYFIDKKQFKKLFTWQHILGGLVFLGIVGTYYLLYHQYNSLENVFTTLFNESSKRTVTNYGIGRTVLHLFTFPFEMFYHFLPWTLLVIYFFKKGVHRLILEHPFIRYNALIFLANIPIYWSSPEVYPRYLLMLAPLIFSVFIYLHQKHQEQNTVHFKILDNFFVIIVILTTLLSFNPFFLARIQFVPYLYPKTLLLNLSLIGLSWWIWKNTQHRILIFVAVLLIARIGFNWFVLPDRNANDWGDEVRKSAIEVGKLTKGESMYLHGGTLLQATTLFYLLKERKAVVLTTKGALKEGNYYIFSPTHKNPDYEKVTELKLRHGRWILDVGLHRNTIFPKK